MYWQIAMLSLTTVRNWFSLQTLLSCLHKLHYFSFMSLPSVFFVASVFEPLFSWLLFISLKLPHHFNCVNSREPAVGPQVSCGWRCGQTCDGPDGAACCRSRLGRGLIVLSHAFSPPPPQGQVPRAGA